MKIYKGSGDIAPLILVIGVVCWREGNLCNRLLHLIKTGLFNPFGAELFFNFSTPVCRM